MTEVNFSNKEQEKEEVDLLQLIKIFWTGRKIIMKYVLISAFIGLLIAIFSSKEYTTTVIIVPQIERGQSGMGNLAGLASLAGVNLNALDYNYISPNIYPQIISSIPFQLELLNTMVTIENLDQPISVFDYYSSYLKPNPILKYTFGLPWLILKSLRKMPEFVPDDSIQMIQISEEQKEVIEIIEDLINIELFEKEGYVKLSCKMPEALASAQLTKRAQELLQEKITEFKIQKTSATLDFIQLRYYDVQKQYNTTQERLAKFRDQNKNVTSAIAITKLQQLSNDYNLAYSIYSDIAKQLEQAKIKVKEDRSEERRVGKECRSRWSPYH